MTIRLTRHRIDIAGKKAVRDIVNPDYLPELVDVFIHNWQTPPTIENSWLTDVVEAQSLSEDRRALNDKPTRVLQAVFTGLTQDSSARIWQSLLRLANQRLLIPINPDATRLNTQANVTATTLLCDASNRRFFPGGLIVIYDLDESRPQNIEFARIDSIGPDGIELMQGVEIEHVVRSKVIPIMQTEISSDIRSRIITDFHIDGSVSLLEVAGPSAIPAWTIGWDYPQADTYRQIPIFDLTKDWSQAVQATIKRPSDQYLSGRSSIVADAGDRPLIGYTFDLCGLTRESASEILRWMDSRRGRLDPFLLISPQRLWSIVDITTDHVDIAIVGSQVDLERFYDYVGIVMNDGRKIVREILDARINGSVFRLRFVESIPSTLADVANVNHVTSAHLVRMSSDTYIETWSTDHAMRTSASVIEIVEEKPVRIEIFSDPIIAANPDAIRDLVLWVTSPNNVRKPDNNPATITGDQVATWEDRRAGVTRALRTEIPPLQLHHEFYAGTDQTIRFVNWVPSPPQKGEFFLSDQELLYSNALGMTLFFLMQRRVLETYDASDDYLLRYLDTSGSFDDVIKWTPTSVQMFETSELAESDHLIITPDILFPKDEFHVICFTWKPRRYARVYQNGHLRGEAPRAVIDLPRVLNEQAQARFLRMANNDMDTPSDFDSSVKAVIAYRRALTVSELNRVGKYLAEGSAEEPAMIQGLTWRKIW